MTADARALASAPAPGPPATLPPGEGVAPPQMLSFPTKATLGWGEGTKPKAAGAKLKWSLKSCI